MNVKMQRLEPVTEERCGTIWFIYADSTHEGRHGHERECGALEDASCDLRTITNP